MDPPPFDARPGFLQHFIPALARFVPYHLDSRRSDSREVEQVLPER